MYRGHIILTALYLQNQAPDERTEFEFHPNLRTIVWILMNPNPIFQNQLSPSTNPRFFYCIQIFNLIKIDFKAQTYVS